MSWILVEPPLVPRLPLRPAISNGDSLILGPLTSAETASVAPVARGAGLPVLAFTNDASQSQPGVWPLGISPDQQIRRLVAAAQAQGKTQFAGLLPDTDFGRAMANGLTNATEAAGLPPPNIRMHPPGHGRHHRGRPRLVRLRQSPRSDRCEGQGCPGAGNRRWAPRSAGTRQDPHPAAVVQRSAACRHRRLICRKLPPSCLITMSIDQAVQIIGPALWADPASGSGAVQGAWYAAPDSSTRSNLERDYTAKYGASSSATGRSGFRRCVGRKGRHRAGPARIWLS